MPIVRLPEADHTAVMGVTAVERRGDRRIGTAAMPPGDLLPAGGALASVPAPPPGRAPAPDAVRLLRRLRDPARWPERTTTIAR